MTSTRDKAVNIFLSLIKDPYYQGSKDKSREEVVWLESQQRARQSQNNEIALSMAVTDESVAVKALLRHLIKASPLITIEQYRALPEDDEDRLKFDAFLEEGDWEKPRGKFWELSDGYEEWDKKKEHYDVKQDQQRTYGIAVGLITVGQSQAANNQRKAQELIMDIVDEFPEAGIPTTTDFSDEFPEEPEPEPIPQALSDLTEEEQLERFGGDEEALADAKEREREQAQRVRSHIPQLGLQQFAPPPMAPLTEEQQKEREARRDEALQNVPRMETEAETAERTQEGQPEMLRPMGKTHVTPTNKSIVLSSYGLKPQDFLTAKQNATELQDMQNASDSFGIPIPGRTPKAKRLFVPTRLLNSISTDGHKRFPFSHFIGKLKSDLHKARDSVTSFSNGQLRNPAFLLGKQEGTLIRGTYSGDASGETSFTNYFDDIESRTRRMPDGSDLKLSDSPLGELIQKVQEVADAYGQDIGTDKGKMYENLGQNNTPAQEQDRLARVRQTITRGYTERLKEYEVAIDKLEESMSENMHFDVDEKDTSMTRTQSFAPEMAAELLRLEFLEDASQALGTVTVGRNKFPPITPFTDFIAGFRFSPDEYDDTVKDENKQTEKDRFGESIDGQHWENETLTKQLLDQVFSNLRGKVPPQLAESLYVLQEDGKPGELRAIDTWQPTVISAIAGINPEGDWHTAITTFLDGKREKSQAASEEAKNAPKVQSKAGKARAQINQLYRVSEGKASVEGFARMAKIGREFLEQGLEFDERDFVDWGAEDLAETLKNRKLAEMAGNVPQEDPRVEEGELESRSAQQLSINDKFTLDGIPIVDEDNAYDTSDEALGNVEEGKDQQLSERLKANLRAFYDAILADTGGREGKHPSLQDDFIGEGKALFLNDNNEIEWDVRKFDSSTDANLEKINGFIQDILLPRNVPEGEEDSDYKPEFTFFGAAADGAFRRTGRIVPTNATIMSKLREAYAKELGIAPEDMNESEELEKAMGAFSALAPGIDQTYKDLLLDKNSKNNISDMGIESFLRDMAMPLLEEANKPIDSELSETERQEHINNSQAMHQFWKNVEEGGYETKLPDHTISDIAKALHPALAAAGKVLGGDNYLDTNQLEDDDIEQLPEYDKFITEIREMISPRTIAAASKRQYEMIIPRFAKKMIQITSAKNYDSDNPNIQWRDPLTEDVPLIVLDTIRSISSNPEYGVATLIPQEPSLHNLLGRYGVTQTGGYTQWSAQNEDAISFLNDLLGTDIFTTWAGQKKFKRILNSLPAKAGGEAFGLDNEGHVSPRTIEGLFKLFELPATEEEWSSPDYKTLTDAERWGGINPYESLIKEEPFKGMNADQAHSIVNHFYTARHPNFYPRDITRLGTPQNAFEKAMRRISDTAFRGLGAGLTGATGLADQMRNDLGTVELNRPFHARGYPITRHSPANLDDYVQKVLSVLRATQEGIEVASKSYKLKEGETVFPLLPLITDTVTGGVNKGKPGDLLRRISEIEDNYVKAEGRESWRNQFHKQYWDAWNADEGSVSDPELHKHVSNMWSARPMDYHTSVNLSSLFSLEKLLKDRGWDERIQAGNTTLEQNTWLRDIMRDVSAGFTQMSESVNNVNQGLDPEQQQREAANFGFDHAPFLVGNAVKQLGMTDEEEVAGLTQEEAKQLNIDYYVDFDELFPDIKSDENPIVPKAVLDWFKSDKNYGDGETPSEEHADKIPMLASDVYDNDGKLINVGASGDPQDENYLKPHPDFNMDAATKRVLTNFPWSSRGRGPAKPITEAQRLFTELWDDRPPSRGGQRYLDKKEKNTVGATTVAQEYQKEVDRWRKQGLNEYSPFVQAPQETSTGPTNHAELYDHIVNHTLVPRRGREIIHPHEEDYNHTDTPNMGRATQAILRSANMIDENNQYTPEAHTYMNTLPKARHENQEAHQLPESMANSYAQGFQKGFKPIQPPEPGIEGQDLNKSWINKALDVGGGSEEESNVPGGPDVSGKPNRILEDNPIFIHPNTHTAIRGLFDTNDAFTEWVEKHGMPVHPNSTPGQRIIELPFMYLKPRLDSVTKQPSTNGGRLPLTNINIKSLLDIPSGGAGAGSARTTKKGILSALYGRQQEHATTRAKGPTKRGSNKVLEQDIPHWEAVVDYKMGINQQWINMLENQLIEDAVSVRGLDPDDDDAHQEFIAGLKMAGHDLYTQSPNREANAFKGYMHRWAALHGLPTDEIEEGLYNHDAMKEFLSTELKDGKGRPLHYLDRDGNERFRFRSFPFKMDKILGHFVETHEHLFGEHGIDPDVFAKQKMDELKAKQAEQLGGAYVPPEETEAPEETQEEMERRVAAAEAADKEAKRIEAEEEEIKVARQQAEDNGTLVTQTYPSGGIRVFDSETGQSFEDTRKPEDADKQPLTPEELRAQGDFVFNRPPQRTETGAGPKAPAEPRFPKGEHAWNRIRQHLIDTTTMTEADIDLDMDAMDESDLKVEWQAYSKTRKKTEQAKPKIEVESMNEDTKQKYINKIREHSHEMHGTDIHGDDKFEDMSDKQLSDAYHASHKDASTHRAKQAASGKQNYANDIVTRLSALTDDAPEDKILNQARSLASEFLKHRTIFDKPALAHWQTLMQDLKAKATAAGVDWEPIISNEINQYQDKFGSPEHLEEVNETKREQQQQQAEYTGTLDARYAQAQQHPEYRPGHFVEFIEDERGYVRPRGFDYNNPIDRDYDASEMDELGEPPMFEDNKGNVGYGMYHPHSESWVNPFVYEKARKNMLTKNKNPHLESTSIIRNGRQWTNTHDYDDDADIDERHAFAIPTQKKQAELEQRGQNQMGYMIGTDGNIVGLDSDWNSVLDNRSVGQEQSPSRIVQDYHIRRLQQQHEQNPEYIGTRREAPIVEPKSPQAQQAQARSQQQPQQQGTALERFAQRQQGKPPAKPHSFNPQDFMSEGEKNLYDYNSFFQDKGAVGRGVGRALRGQNPFSATPGIENYWADRTKEYETQNKVNDLYQQMHTKYFGQAPDKPFYGSSTWSKQRAINEGLGYDTGLGQSQQPDQFKEPAYEEQSQPKPQPQPQVVGDALSRLKSPYSTQPW